MLIFFGQIYKTLHSESKSPSLTEIDAVVKLVEARKVQKRRLRSHACRDVYLEYAQPQLPTVPRATTSQHTRHNRRSAFMGDAEKIEIGARQ